MYNINICYEPKTVEEALNYLNKEELKIISGGTDVLVNLRDNDIEPIDLISIHEIEDLKFIDEDFNNIYIGTGTNFDSIIESDIIKNNIPYFSEALLTIAGPQIRNMGTIGGNICNGVTSADSATMLLCMDAKLHIENSQGKRVVEIQEFYKGFKKVDLKKDELLTMIEINKKNIKNYYGTYIKNAKRKAMDIALLGISVLVKSNELNNIEDIKIALGVAGPVPVRCLLTEKKLIGASISDIEEIVRDNILKEITPRDSWRASKEYREQLIIVGVTRAIKKCMIERNI